MFDHTTFNHLKLTPISGAIGAEVEGVNLRHMTPDLLDEVLRAWGQYGVLFFRDQHLSGHEMEEVVLNFGQPSIVHFVNPLEGTTYINHLLRSAEATRGARNVGDRWHVDQSVRVESPTGFLLQSVDCPPVGGDTMFCNLYLAYDYLSEGLKALCDELIVIHSPKGAYGSAGTGGGGAKKSIVPANGSRNMVKYSPEEMQAYINKETEHPLVCVHHISGRKYLYITGEYCIRFKGWTEEESKPLLDYLYQQATKPEMTCRFRWSKGALALIDNRAAMHYAINDYAGHRREMYRLQFQGPAPVGPAMLVRTQAELDADRASLVLTD